MSFQLTRTHTSVVLAATTIAASLVVIPSLAEGNSATDDPFCGTLVGADARINAEYNPAAREVRCRRLGHLDGHQC